MKIIFFAALYRPFKGGYVESIHELAKCLAERGHNVKILTCNTHGAAAKEVMDGVEIIRVSCWNFRWLNGTYPIPKPVSFLRIARRLKNEKIDIVSTQTRFFPTTWLGFLFAKLGRIPCVHTERGAYHPTSKNWLISGAGKFIDHICGGLVCRFSDRVVGVSEAACNFTRHLGARDPVKIYNGVDVTFWQSSRPDSGGSQDVTFVGRLIEAKGVQDLLKAAASLNFKGTTHPYIINVIGDGPFKDRLIKLSGELGIGDRVKFWGELDREGIKNIFGRTAVFVNPSYSEGLPRSVLEAGAAGLAIVATDVGGTKEIVKQPDGGFLVPPRDVSSLAKKIALLLKDVQLRDELGKNIQRRIQEEFGWEKVIKQFLELLNWF